MNELVLAKINNLKKIISIEEPKTNKKRNRKYRQPRPSAIDLDKCFKKNSLYNLKQDMIIEKESSDSNSMIEAHINNEITLKIPSLSKISKTIFDENTIMIINDFNTFPKEAINKNGIGLLLVGIESWISEKNILYFLEQVPDLKKVKINNNFTYDKFLENKIKINYIKKFSLGEKYCVFVSIQSINQIKILGQFFLHPLKKNNPTLNSKGEQIDFYYAYDSLTLTKSFWYSVILRNLPRDCSYKTLYQFCDNIIRDGIKYCFNPININDIFCSIVVCEDLIYAQILCERLNNYMLPNKKIIKANLHPYTCKIMKYYNNDKYFSSNGYLFNKDIENGEECLKKSKSCVELLFPQKFEYFNCIKKRYQNQNNINNNYEKIKEEIIKENSKKENEIINNNEKKESIANDKKKKKIKDKDNSIDILKSLKSILDIKNKKKKYGNNISNEDIQKEAIKVENSVNKIIENENLNINFILEKNQDSCIENIEKLKNKEIINENIGKKKENSNETKSETNNEIEYYSYNFPNKSFFDDLERGPEIISNLEYDLMNNSDYYENKTNNNKDYNHREIEYNPFRNKDYYENKSQCFNCSNFKDIKYFSNNKSFSYNLFNDLYDKEDIFCNLNEYKNDYYFNNSGKNYYSFNKEIIDGDINLLKNRQYYSHINSDKKVSYYNSDIREKEIDNDYKEIKKNIKRNLKEIKLFYKKGKKVDLNHFKNIMEENIYIEDKIIYDIEDQYKKNGNRKKILKYLNGQLTFEELDKKINRIKKHLDRKFENINFFSINDNYLRYDKKSIRKKNHKSFDYSFYNIYCSSRLNYKEADSNYYKLFNEGNRNINNEYINKKRYLDYDIDINDNF